MAPIPRTAVWHFYLSVAALLLFTAVTSTQGVRLLLDNGDSTTADLKAKYEGKPVATLNKALGHASKDNDAALVEVLIGLGAKTSARRGSARATALHVAARYGSLRAAKMLIEKGADVGVKDAEGRTPLHYAATDGYADIVKVLIENGAYVHSKNNKGNTALHIASWEGHAEIVKILVRNGADVDARTPFGTTPLHLASRHGDLESVEELLGFGADVDARDEKGRTPLRLASEWAYVKVVKALLEWGADKTIKDESGKTAKDMIAKGRSSKDREELKDLLG